MSTVTLPRDKMARQQALPSVDETPERPEPVTAAKVTKQVQSCAAIIEEGYLPRRVDVKLPILHRRILRDKLRRLQDSGAKLKDGTEVSDKTKVILWMLENEAE